MSRRTSFRNNSYHHAIQLLNQVLGSRGIQAHLEAIFKLDHEVLYCFYVVVVELSTAESLLYISLYPHQVEPL